MYPIIKRILDIIFSIVGFIILSPLFIILIFSIKLDSKGPVIFAQKRVGQHKQIFMMLKFRTMKNDAPKDIPTHLLENQDKWITNVGRFMRRTSLDELPQIINIIKGDMSVVGPRPALYNQYDLITKRDLYGANDVPQGLTGWAQINGRDELHIGDKAEMDGEYVRNFGIAMDAKCLFKTFGSVLKGEGFSEGGPNTKEVSDETNGDNAL